MNAPGRPQTSRLPTPPPLSSSRLCSSHRRMRAAAPHGSPVFPFWHCPRGGADNLTTSRTPVCGCDARSWTMLRLARRSGTVQTQHSLAALAAGRRWKSALCASARRREFRAAPAAPLVTRRGQSAWHLRVAWARATAFGPPVCHTRIVYLLTIAPVSSQEGAPQRVPSCAPLAPLPKPLVAHPPVRSGLLVTTGLPRMRTTRRTFDSPA